MTQLINLVGHVQWYALLEERQSRVGVSELRGNVYQCAAVFRSRRDIGAVFVDKHLDDVRVASLCSDV